MESSNPTSAGSPQSFTDPAYFEQERRKVFHNSWICVAHTSQLQNTGDYVTVDLFGAPIVILRDEAGEIRTLSNVCLHRSMPIATGAGNTHVLTCPYHLWAYGLDGKLKSTPLIKAEEGLDKTHYQLPCLQTEIWQGFVFVNRERELKPLADQVTELAAKLAPYKLDEMVHVGSMEFASPWNWKIMVENFLEAYHHIGPHRNTLQPIYPALQSSRVDQTGPFSVLDMPGIDDHSPLWAICLYPNMLFALDPGNPGYLTWYQMSNMRHDYFDLTVHVFLDETRAANPEEVKGALEMTNMIHQEDIPMCEGVQRGVQSPFAIHGPLAKLEAPLTHFRNWIDSQLNSIGT